MELVKEKFEARSLSDALDKASDKFKVSRENLEYRVVKESQGGFFGLLGGKVIIEVNVIPSKLTTAPARESDTLPDEVRLTSHASNVSSSSPQNETTGRDRQKKFSKSGRDRRRGGWESGANNSRNITDSTQGSAYKKTEVLTDDKSGCTPREPRKISQEAPIVKSEVAAFLNGVFEHLSEIPPYEISEDDQYIIVKFSFSEDSIFNNGIHVIEALRTLLDKAINKGPVLRKRIRFHSHDLKETPIGDFAATGLELGKKVLENGKPMSIRGLSPQLRKTIHTVLMNEKGLETISSGDGIFRKIYIVPEKKPS